MRLSVEESAERLLVEHLCGRSNHHRNQRARVPTERDGGMRLSREMNVRNSMVRVPIFAAVVTLELVMACTKGPQAEPGARETAAMPMAGSNEAPAVETFDGLSVGGTFDRARTV